MNEFQLIVIGAGPGGYTAALHAAKMGLRTAVVENRELGGTCLNRGCIPTKTLLHSSELYHNACHAEHAGVRVQGAEVDVPAIFANKRRITEQLSGGIAALFKKEKVTLFSGCAIITAPGTVEVTDAEGNKETHTADHILVATGSVPARVPIPGIDLPGVLTSDDLLEGSDHLYRSIVIIGGGVIGVELATFYCELGCEVTLVEGLDRLLPTMDKELGQNLAQILKKQGVKIYTGAMVKQIQQSEDGLAVSFTSKEETVTVSGEVVLCAIGRKPYFDGLFAEGLQPELDGRRLRVDERYQTSIPGIYAIGDVSAKIQLAHVASAQGVAAVDMLCGKTNTVNMNLVPSCIYCRPEIASVGLTEAEAKDREIPVKVGKCVMFSNARTMISGTGRSFIKVLAHAQTREILGAQLMCEHSTDMISQFSEAIANRMTVDQMLLAMRPHPTFEEAVAEALEDLQNKFTI